MDPVTAGLIGAGATSLAAALAECFRRQFFGTSKKDSDIASDRVEYSSGDVVVKQPNGVEFMVKGPLSLKIYEIQNTNKEVSSVSRSSGHDTNPVASRAANSQAAGVTNLPAANATNTNAAQVPTQDRALPQAESAANLAILESSDKDRIKVTGFSMINGDQKCTFESADIMITPQDGSGLGSPAQTEYVKSIAAAARNFAGILSKAITESISQGVVTSHAQASIPQGHNASLAENVMHEEQVPLLAAMEEHFQ